MSDRKRLGQPFLAIKKYFFPGSLPPTSSVQQGPKGFASGCTAPSLIAAIQVVATGLGRQPGLRHRWLSGNHDFRVFRLDGLCQHTTSALTVYIQATLFNGIQPSMASSTDSICWKLNLSHIVTLLQTSLNISGSIRD